MREPLTYTQRDILRARQVIKRLGHSWYYFKEQNISLMAPPKCGSSSIKQFIWMNELENDIMMIKHHEARGDIYCVVRDPVDRFCSLWKGKCRDKGHTRHNEHMHSLTPSRLMDFIESGVKDVHFTPQVDMHGALSPMLIPLQHFGSWWEQNIFGQLGKFNATEGIIDIDDELRARVLTFYAEDVILHTRAEKEFKLNIQ